MIYANTVNQGELFFRRRYEDEPRGGEQEWCEMLKGRWFVKAGFVLENKTNLDDTGNSCYHQGVTKRCVDRWKLGQLDLSRVELEPPTG